MTNEAPIALAYEGTGEGIGSLRRARRMLGRLAVAYATVQLAFISFVTVAGYATLQLRFRFDQSTWQLVARAISAIALVTLLVSGLMIVTRPRGGIAALRIACAMLLASSSIQSIYWVCLQAVSGVPRGPAEVVYSVLSIAVSLIGLPAFLLAMSLPLGEPRAGPSDAYRGRGI